MKNFIDRVFSDVTATIRLAAATLEQVHAIHGCGNRAAPVVLSRDRWLYRYELKYLDGAATDPSSVVLASFERSGDHGLLVTIPSVSALMAEMPPPDHEIWRLEGEAFEFDAYDLITRQGFEFIDAPPLPQSLPSLYRPSKKPKVKRAYSQGGC